MMASGKYEFYTLCQKNFLFVKIRAGVRCFYSHCFNFSHNLPEKSPFLNLKFFNPTGGVRGGMMADNDQALPHRRSEAEAMRAANAARREWQVRRRAVAHNSTPTTRRYFRI